jgi:hypothetical protein
VTSRTQAVPLRSFELVQRLIAGTASAAGLSVTARLKRGGNERGETVSDEAIKQLLLTRHNLCPEWNYTLSPRSDPEEMAN